MSPWLIETFGERQLTQALWAINLMTLPVWIAMILFPGSNLVQRLASPYLLPVIFTGFLVYLYFLSWSMGLPDFGGYHYRAARTFLHHPLVFIALWCKLQILNLFMGCVIFQEANRLRLRVPLELALSIFFGPLGLAVFALRRNLRQVFR
jgi:hypothetical protein